MFRHCYDRSWTGPPLSLNEAGFDLTGRWLRALTGQYQLGGIHAVNERGPSASVTAQTRMAGRGMLAGAQLGLHGPGDIRSGNRTSVRRERLALHLPGNRNTQ